MSRVKTINLSAVAGDADGIAASQTPGGAGALTLTGTQPPEPIIIDITSTLDDSARTFVVTGTDRFGEVMTETVNPGPNAGTVQTTKQFATVTEVTVDAATAGAITVGWGGDVYSRWLPLATEFDEINIGLGVTVTGTVNFDLEYTYRNVQGRDESRVPYAPRTGGDIEALLAAESFVDPDIDGDTASIAKRLISRATAIRFKMNAGSTGSLVARITEAGNR